jgi:hypothetical protein
MKSLIFSAVGNPLYFHSEYDSDNHWRYTKPERNYETIVYQYNDFEIEPDTFDFIDKGSGYKWIIAKKFLQTFDYSNYEYIGFFDDDLVTDIKSVNRALEIDKNNDIKLFQMSLNDDSEKQHRVTFQDKNLSYTLTNFVEGMGVFVHQSLMNNFVKFWDFHEVRTGWGFDIVLSPMLRTKAAVIHEVSMHHVPKHNPYYDKSFAFEEMYHVLNNVYPKYMKNVYDLTVEPYTEPQQTYRMALKL